MINVSRETAIRLDTFEALVRKWNPTVNLVASADLPRLRARHTLDSGQLAEFAPAARTWCDLGSGGGFPGIVIAILRPDLDMVLIESDQRKAAFLRSMIRSLSLSCKVLTERIEQVTPQQTDVVSARALAPLSRLIEIASRHGTPDTTYVFPKGIHYLDEIDAAKERWKFDVDVRPSKTEKGSVILTLENIARV